jgi:hypothetical protein
MAWLRWRNFSGLIGPTLPSTSDPLPNSASIVASRRNSMDASSIRPTCQTPARPNLQASLTKTMNWRRMYLRSPGRHVIPAENRPDNPLFPTSGRLRRLQTSYFRCEHKVLRQFEVVVSVNRLSKHAVRYLQPKRDRRGCGAGENRQPNASIRNGRKYMGEL